VNAKIQVGTKLLRLGEVTGEQWQQLRQLQGRFATFYLRFRYGAPDTRILLAFADAELAHVGWIVPAYKLQARYPFVSDGSYSIISCLTTGRLRGLRIYPSQIQKVVQSDVSAKRFWIWTESTNTPSLKGIGKAGGIKVGEFIQTKWFWGCTSHVRYFPEGTNIKWH